MLVLIDIEWIEKQDREKELTQISAVRVDEKWKILSEFHVTIRPADIKYRYFGLFRIESKFFFSIVRKLKNRCSERRNVCII